MFIALFLLAVVVVVFWLVESWLLVRFGRALHDLASF
jgi:ABC-type branched-subunit amino acid transport system permease subunit